MRPLRTLSVAGRHCPASAVLSWFDGCAAMELPEARTRSSTGSRYLLAQRHRVPDRSIAQGSDLRTRSRNCRSMLAGLTAGLQIARRRKGRVPYARIPRPKAVLSSHCLLVKHRPAVRFPPERRETVARGRRESATRRRWQATAFAQSNRGEDDTVGISRSPSAAEVARVVKAEKVLAGGRTQVLFKQHWTEER